MSPALMKAMEEFMDAVEARLAKHGDETRALIAEVRAMQADILTRGAASVEVVGPAGPPGRDGRDGVDGKDGAPGERGADGAQGRDGLAGRDGAAGERGQSGERGEAGPKGDRGNDGEPGAPGAAGAPGAQGPAGLPGSEGAVGPKGDRGERGESGANGERGERGLPGERGERGADGIATREEIEAIVERRVADIQVRTFADIYQGVYESGKHYGRGLLATWGGSLWLSQTETLAKPGESTDWRLIVKKGADGRK